MTQNLFNGLPPRVVTYIKIHLRYIFSTGLFSYQEREDLIQDLVLFYLERFYRKKEVPDDYLFVSIKTKAQQILRTRLRQLQSGFFATESLNSMCEEEGFEAVSDFSLSTLENEISIRELDEKVKEQGISGRTMRDVRSRMKNELEYQVNEKQENSIRLKE